MTVQFGAVTIDWFGLATIRLAGRTGVVIYVDPGPEQYDVLEGAPADGDLVVVSHGHHYDPESIRRVAHEDAIVVVHEAVDARDLEHTDEQPEALPYEIERVRADESFILGPLDLYTTPAYNDPAGPHVDEDGQPHHPEGEGCGFGVTIDGVSAFWPGDTDAFAFHEALGVDAFFPPIGGTFTMDRHEAAELAERLAPDLVLPVHYGTFDAIAADADAFVVDIANRGVPVVLDS
ncbi:MBL fold metallo-hydrolase [Salinadaptatus halalkaliphilus]|uniref:MBL fold metallo-hydrolase n=1 Tax=Salinadaptatus halalkaliphilus TaxID=2419781 RepID=A0A4S3TL60_9EURY|nr:MBL fold metallo-hydrolase [Salinadaptatus halalkaliphilus]THE63695.1 MBL fold metallo-hydrolase [Salinadaptatus halalkaliphilus]